MRNRLLLTLTSLLFAAPAFAAVQWRGDFETGDLSQWTSKQIVSADRIQIVNDPVRQGQHAVRVLVHKGDDPINASGNRNELVYDPPEKEGSESWFRWQTMFAPDFPSANTWQLFAQWHQPEDCCGSPPVQFYAEGEEIKLTLSTAETLVWKAPLVRGVWHDFIVHVKFSDDPKVGFLELWYDGEHVLPKTYAATRANTYLKLGLYRDEVIAQDGVVYQDGMMKADTMEDLIAAGPPMPGATPPSATAMYADPTTANANGSPTTTTTPVDDPVGTTGTGLQDPNDPAALDPQNQGGCSAAGGGAIGLAALGLLGMLRRRKQRS